MDEKEDAILKKLNEQDQKLDEVYKSVRSMKRYFLWTLILSLAFLVLPLIGLAFVIPTYLKTLNLSSYGL